MKRKGIYCSILIEDTEKVFADMIDTVECFKRGCHIAMSGYAKEDPATELVRMHATRETYIAQHKMLNGQLNAISCYISDLQKEMEEYTEKIIANEKTV